MSPTLPPVLRIPLAVLAGAALAAGARPVLAGAARRVHALSATTVRVERRS